MSKKEVQLSFNGTYRTKSGGTKGDSGKYTVFATPAELDKMMHQDRGIIARLAQQYLDDAAEEQDFNNLRLGLSWR